MAAPMVRSVFRIFRRKCYFYPTIISNNTPICTTSCRNDVGYAGSPCKLEEVELEDEEFRVLVIPGHSKLPDRNVREKRPARKEVPPPRYKSMKTDQDWTKVWPAAQSFKWSVAPFPVRQGYVQGEENDGIPPGKYANAELMKIPNFLHLTPAHIRKHCAALKQYCTQWPEGLETEEDIEQNLPLKITTSTYVLDAPSPRDPRGRGVTLKFKLSSLTLDYHARDKILRLLGDKYDPESDMVTITSERCPTKKQNYEYCMYVLTALFHESWNTEPWESEKEIADMEKYVWDIMPSKATLQETLSTMKEAQKSTDGAVPSTLNSLPEEDIENNLKNIDSVKQYQQSVEDLHNVGEDISALEKYKESVVKMLLPNTS